MIKVKFNRISQRFFYISNLSEWHFSCNPEYNKFWYQKTGPLTKIEKNSLNEARKIFKKYCFDTEKTYHYIGKPFIDSPQAKIWKNVSKLLNKDEIGKLKNIFKTFSDKFNAIFTKEDDQLLKKIAREFKKEIKLNNINEVLKKMEILFNGKYQDYSIHIFKIPKKSKYMGGGANTKQGVVTIEIRSEKDIENGLAVALHEIAHQFFSRNKLNFRKKILVGIEEIYDIPLFKTQGFSSAWEELVLVSFLPDGVLKKYITKRKVSFLKPKYPDIKKRQHLEKFIISKMKSKAEEYIKNKKIIDQEYIDTVLKTAIDFIKISKKNNPVK